MKITNLIIGTLIPAVIIFTSCGHSGIADKHTGVKSLQVSDIKSEDGLKNALAFINGYARNTGKIKKSADIIDWVNSNNLSTMSFKKELKRIIDEAYREEPVAGLDADPVFDAQDFPDKGFELESFDEKTGYLTIRGIDWPEFKLTMKIINESGIWLVDGCGIINIPEDKRAGR